jgi:hypothetical protein
VKQERHCFAFREVKSKVHPIGLMHHKGTEGKKNYRYTLFNPLNAELNPICQLLALLGAHHILHISGIRVNPGARCGWMVNAPVRPLYPLVMTRYPLYRKRGEPQARSGQVWKISPAPGFGPRIVHPVATTLPRPTT